MASPTTIRYSLLKERRGFGDKLFLTLGDGDAGMSAYNPMLIGLGVSLVVFGNPDTLSVRYKLSRVVDDDITDTAERRFVETAPKQWVIEGSLGGPKLGFPQDPQPNYGVPHCYRIELISSNIRREVSQVYYFWLAAGPSGTVAELLARVESGMAPFACCLFKADPGVWTPAVVEPSPRDVVFDHESFGFDEIECQPEDILEGVTNDPADGVYTPGLPDPVFQETAPTPIEPFYTEPSIPAQTTQDEMFQNGFVPAWFHVIGDDSRWHAYMIQHLADSVAATVPGGTVNDIPADYADGPSLIAGPANVGLPIIDDFWKLEPATGADHTITVAQTVTLNLTPPTWASGTKDIVMSGGYDAEWDGGALNGQDFEYAPAATFANLLVTPSHVTPKIFDFVTNLWSAGPVADGIRVDLAGPVTVSFQLFPGLVPGDVMAVQVIIVPGGGITTGIIGPPFGYRLPDNAQASNVYKMDVV